MLDMKERSLEELKKARIRVLELIDIYQSALIKKIENDTKSSAIRLYNNFLGQASNTIEPAINITMENLYSIDGLQFTSEHKWSLINLLTASTPELQGVFVPNTIIEEIFKIKDRNEIYFYVDQSEVRVIKLSEIIVWFTFQGIEAGYNEENGTLEIEVGLPTMDDFTKKYVPNQKQGE